MRIGIGIGLTAQRSAVGVPTIPAFDPANTSALVTLSENNARMTSSSNDRATRSVQSKTPASGAFYFEVELMAVNSGSLIGICNALASMDDWIGSTDRSLGLNASNGTAYTAAGAGAGSAGLTTAVAGDVIGVCLNRNTGKAWFTKNGAFGSGQNPLTDTGGFSSPGGNDIYAAVSNNAGGSARLRTLSSQFSYTPPTGYVAWGA